MKTGRNEPCPCGSGKKFKACCLRADEPVDFFWRKLNAIHAFFATRLLQHAMEEFGGESFDAAWEEFWAYKTDMPDFDPSSHHGPLFFPFYLYHWSPSEDGEASLLPPKARTIASDYLAKHGSSHSELERRFLRAIIETPFSFHEILEVDPGRGFLAKDIFLGVTQYVSERTASKPAQAGDIFYGRIVKVDQLATLVGTSWVFLPPTMKVHILDLRKDVEREYKRSKLPVDERMLFEFDLELRTLFLDLQDVLFNPGTVPILVEIAA